MKHASLKVDGGGRSDAVRGLLTRLLESGFVQAVLVPKPMAAGNAVVQTLVVAPEGLTDALPFAPTMPVQSARVLSDLTSTPFDGRIAAVLKPCELRATVELAKFLQVDLDHVVTVGIDCHGTVDVNEYAAMSPETREAVGRGTEPATTIREACRMCVHPTPTGADLSIGVIGIAEADPIVLSVGERFAAEVVEALGLETVEGEPGGRAAAVEALVGERTSYREDAMARFAEDTGTVDGLLEALAACIGCRNCMHVCPICYCKECVFESSIFEHRADQFLSRARRRGVLRVPTETLMFHLTRLSHMGTSCVGCGVCESACPNDVPVSSLFNLIGTKLQALFDYVPGADPSAEPPVSAFKEKELVDVAPND